MYFHRFCATFPFSRFPFFSEKQLIRFRNSFAVGVISGRFETIRLGEARVKRTSSRKRLSLVNERVRVWESACTSDRAFESEIGQCVKGRQRHREREREREWGCLTLNVWGRLRASKSDRGYERERERERERKTEREREKERPFEWTN